MSLHKEYKQSIIAKYSHHNRDCGCIEVQIALLTAHIEHLKNHFNKNKKDHHGRRGLLCMVSRRRKLLNYLKKENTNSYNHIRETLGLRR